jgi:hypothetical protein
VLVLLLRLAWIAGFLVGTTTHTIDLIAGGLDVYAGYPDGVRLYWVSLTALDPLTVVLIALRRRAGVVLGVAVMVSDVTINLTMSAVYGGLGMSGLILQCAFAVLVLSTAPLLWRSSPLSTPSSPDIAG